VTDEMLTNKAACTLLSRCSDRA